jgi:hypothetical protein
MFLGQRMEKRQIAAFRTSRYLNELDRSVFKGVLGANTPWQQAALETFIGRTYAVSFYQEATWRMLDLHNELKQWYKAKASEMNKGYTEDSPKIKGYQRHIDELTRELEAVERAQMGFSPTGGQ